MAPTTTTQLSPTRDIPNATTLNKQAPKRQSRRRKFHHSTSQLNSGMCAPLYPTSQGGQPQQVMMCQQMVLPAVPMANLIPSQWALYPDMKVYQQVPFAICPQYPSYSAGVDAPSTAPSTTEVAKAHKKQETATANALATVTVNPIIPIKDLPGPTEMEPELDEPIDFEEDGDDMYDIDDDLTSGLITTGTATTEEDLDPSEDMVEDPVTSDDTPSSSSIQQGGSSTDSSPLLRPRPRSILKQGAKAASPKRTVTFSADTEFIERTLQFELEKANPSFRRQRKPRGFATPTPTPAPITTALSPPPSASDNSGSENSGSDYPKDLQRALGLHSRKVSSEAREEARKAAANRRRTRGTFQAV